MVAVLYVLSCDALKQESEKIVGTSGAVKILVSCVNIVTVWLYYLSQSLKCDEIILKLVAEVSLPK